MLYDSHMHTAFSGDSEADAVDMIMAAKAKGLSGVTITDHLDYDFPEEPNIFLLDLPDYYAKISDLSKKYSEDGFEVLKGIELGLQPSCIAKNKEVISGYDFDFCIGSTHLVQGQDPYYPKFWTERDMISTCQIYYEEILQNILGCLDVDAVGHLDYAFRYAPVLDKTEIEDTYTRYSDVVDEILNVIIKNDIALEVNTGSFRSGLKYPNPGPLIVRRYRELGGRLITLGADAHKPADIAAHFEEMADYLKQCGFKSYYVYKKHIPVEIDL